jgi:tellurite resistance protein
MCVNKLLSSELSYDGVPKNKYLYGAMKELFGSNLIEYKEECTISIMSSSVESQKEKRVLKKYVESEDFWNISSYALAMSVAEADGEVSKEEVKVIDQIADLSADSIKIYNQIVEFDDEDQVIINAVTLMGDHNEALKAEIINNLLFLSQADGEISDSEIEKIKSISSGCGLSDKKFKSVFEIYVPNNT